MNILQKKSISAKSGKNHMLMSVMSSVLILFFILAQQPSYSANSSNGIILVRGALIQSPCSLEMDSAYQVVSLGEQGSSLFYAVGQQGKPVNVTLRLQDCMKTLSYHKDTYTNTVLWSDIQPSISVSIKGVSDIDDPQLIMLKGVSGIGLRILDSKGDNVWIGNKSRPQLLTSSQSTLVYKLVPERTASPLISGAFQANIDFHLNYN